MTVKSGIVSALNKETRQKRVEFNVDAPISLVGMSIGDGILFVPTGKIKSEKDEPSISGPIVTFVRD